MLNRVSIFFWPLLSCGKARCRLKGSALWRYTLVGLGEWSCEVS